MTTQDPIAPSMSYASYRTGVACAGPMSRPASIIGVVRCDVRRKAQTHPTVTFTEQCRSFPIASASRAGATRVGRWGYRGGSVALASSEHDVAVGVAREGTAVTHPEPGAGQEPPTTRDPFPPGAALPAPPPWAPPQPFFAPGSASVPQQVPQQIPPQIPPQIQQQLPQQVPLSAAVTVPLGTAADGPGYPPPPYPPPGYLAGNDYLGTPYPPRPKGRTGLIVGIVVGVLVLCLAGSVGGGLLIARSLDTTANGPSTAAATSSTPQPRGSVTPWTSADTQRYLGDLRQLLLPRPAGTSPWVDFADADGKLTLGETKNLFTEPDAVGKELSSYKFERGAVTHWSKDKVFVLIFLFQFDSAADAQHYLTAQQTDGINGYETKGEFGLIPDSILFVDDTADQDSDRSTIMVSCRGDIVSYLTMWHPDAIDLPTATALAVSQHKRIP